LETEFYSKLDNAACELTREIISILEDKKVPNLKLGARRLLWQFYAYNAYKRHPNTWRSYFDNLDTKSFKKKLTTALVDGGRDPEKAKLYTENLIIDEVMINNSTQIARADQTDSILKNLQKLGVIIGVALEGSSFVLPSLAVRIGEVDENNQKEIWIPIHPKYAIMPNRENGKTNILFLNNRRVRHLNEHWYSISKTVVSTSKKLLISLARNVDRQKISFE